MQTPTCIPCGTGCKASLSTVLDEHEVLKTGSEHGLSEHKKEMYTTRSSLKRIATEDINERPSKLLCKTVASLPSITAKDVDNLCRQVRGNRLKTRPKLPKNRVEFLMVLNEHPSHNHRNRRNFGTEAVSQLKNL